MISSGSPEALPTFFSFLEVIGLLRKSTCSTLQFSCYKLCCKKKLRSLFISFLTWVHCLCFLQTRTVLCIGFKIPPNMSISTDWFKRYKRVLCGKCELISLPWSLQPSLSFACQYIVNFVLRKHQLIHHFKPLHKCPLFLPMEFVFQTALVVVHSALLVAVMAMLYSCKQLDFSQIKFCFFVLNILWRYWQWGAQSWLRQIF